MMELVKEAGLERPGPDFAKAIMDKLEPKTATAVYSPLISKKAWWVIDYHQEALFFSKGLLKSF